MSGKPLKDVIEALYKPVESLVKTLAGPAAEEIGLTFRDSVQAWRFKRQVRLFQRVKEICNEAGIKPQAVKLQLLFDIVDKATLEEDDELQDRWANLLSNAADSRVDRCLISAAFPDILRQLSKVEAVYLEQLYIHPKGRGLTSEGWKGIESKDYSASGAATPSMSFIHQMPMPIDPVQEDNLRRLGLIELFESPGTMFQWADRSVVRQELRGRQKLIDRERLLRFWKLTALGNAFIAACTAPKSPDIKKRH